MADNTLIFMKFTLAYQLHSGLSSEFDPNHVKNVECLGRNSLTLLREVWQSLSAFL